MLLTPAAALRKWQRQIGSEIQSAPWVSYLAALRRSLHLASEAPVYRGISRFALERWSESDPPADQRNGLARLRLAEVLGPECDVS